MDEIVRLKQLLIDNGFFEKEELENLMSSQSNVEDILEEIVKSIGSRDRKVVQRFIDVVDQSGLVTTNKTDSTDSGHQCMCNTKNNNNEFINQMMYQLDLLVTVDDIEVKKATEVRGPPECYPMSRKRRGYCLIINNMKFRKYLYREGSIVDELRLKQVFEQLGFELKIYHNLSANDITEKLEKLSKHQKLSEDDALVVIILSHGTVDDVVIGSDDEPVSIQSLLNYFNVKNCRQLIDKPKIFFINACRGGKKDDGVDLSHILSSMSGGGSFMYRGAPKATWSDFFVVYSTSKDYVSLRNPRTGSVFAYELATGLAQWSCNIEFVKLITQKVADSVEQRQSTMDEGDRALKQAIETRVLGRIKDLYFNPGYYEK